MKALLLFILAFFVCHSLAWLAAVIYEKVNDYPKHFHTNYTYLFWGLWRGE